MSATRKWAPQMTTEWGGGRDKETSRVTVVGEKDLLVATQEKTSKQDLVGRRGNRIRRTRADGSRSKVD